MFPPWHQHHTESWFWPGTPAGWALLSAEGSNFCASSSPKPCEPQDSCHSTFSSWVQKGVCEPRVGGSVVADLSEVCNLFERVANHVQSLCGFSQWGRMHWAFIFRAEWVCSSLCLLPQFPCLKTPSPEQCPAFLFPAYHILLQVHTAPITSLGATSSPVTHPCKLHRDRTSTGWCVTTRQPEWWLLLINLSFPPSLLFPSPKSSPSHSRMVCIGRVTSAPFLWDSAFTAMFLVPIFIKSSFWK